MMYNIINMTYKEKVAWLSLVAMVITFGPYFTMVALHAQSGEVHAMPDLRQLVTYGLVVVVQLIILGIGHLYLRFTSPDEWRTPADERDLAIMQRATTWGYYVLLTGMIFVGCIVPFTAGGWTIVNGALFSIIAAETVRYAVVVTNYRRQT